MKDFNDWLMENKGFGKKSIIGREVSVNGRFPTDRSRRAIVLKVLPQDDTHDLGFTVKYLDNGETQDVSCYYIPAVFSPPFKQMVAPYIQKE